MYFMENEDLGQSHIEQFPKSRIPTLDFLALGDKNHYVMSLIEVDVTKGRQMISEHEKRTGLKLSFTSWLLICIGKAASEHKAVHSMMMGRKKIISFDDVDISITVEKSINGKKAPMPLVIRKSNEKNLLQIHEEIRKAQLEDINGAAVLGRKGLNKKMKFYTSLPKFLRNIMIRMMLKDPVKKKKMMGTIIVTSDLALEDLTQLS